MAANPKPRPLVTTDARAQHLAHILDVLTAGPLTAGEIAAKLQAAGVQVDEARVKSLLYFEGEARVERDPATLRYRLKP